MPAARRTQAERRDETRNAILRAAAARFLERGVAATSLDDVAAQAGVTKGALYHYFASKDDLVAAVVGALATFDPVAGTAEPSGSEVARAAIDRLPPLQERALNYELYALAARNTRIRDAFGARVRRALDELADAHRAPLRDVVIAGALIEGLWIQRLLNPELVTDEVFTVAGSLLEHLTDHRAAPEDGAGDRA